MFVFPLYLLRGLRNILWLGEVSSLSRNEWLEFDPQRNLARPIAAKVGAARLCDLAEGRLGHIKRRVGQVRMIEHGGEGTLRPEADALHEATDLLRPEERLTVPGPVRSPTLSVPKRPIGATPTPTLQHVRRRVQQQ